jgi:hypothetical protein
MDSRETRNASLFSFYLVTFSVDLWERLSKDFMNNPQWSPSTMLSSKAESNITSNPALSEILVGSDKVPSPPINVQELKGTIFFILQLTVTKERGVDCELSLSCFLPTLINQVHTSLFQVFNRSRRPG